MRVKEGAVQREEEMEGRVRDESKGRQSRRRERVKESKDKKEDFETRKRDESKGRKCRRRRERRKRGEQEHELLQRNRLEKRFSDITVVGWSCCRGCCCRRRLKSAGLRPWEEKEDGKPGRDQVSERRERRLVKEGRAG